MRPLIFVFMYVFVVIGFAKSYQVFCAGDFYAPYAHLERSWKDEEFKGNIAIEGALIRATEDYASQRGPITGEDLNLLESGDQSKRQSVHLVRISGIHVADFHVDGHNFTFAVAFTAPTDRTPPHFDVTNHAFVPPMPIFRGYQVYSGRLVTSEPLIAPPLFPSNYSTIVPGGLVYLKLIESIDPSPSIRNPFFRSLAPYEGNALERKIYLSQEETSTLNDIGDEYAGISTKIGQNFGRMLYLSVVISSTLGLGDIVPLSPLARLLVGLEVFLGIVVAGAFVNSVGFKK